MKARTRIAATIVTGAALIAAGGGGAALATSGTAAAATHADAGTAASTSTAHGNQSTFSWHPLRLLNGWKANSARYYGTPSYAIKDGVLYLSGILDGDSTTGPQVAVLPSGARPKHFLWLIYYNFGGAGSGLIGNMEIEPDGDMFAYSNGGRILDPSLAAISFPLSS